MADLPMLEQIAQRFELYASDQRAMMRRTAHKGSQDNCVAKAGLYESVAAELRQMGRDNREAFASDIATKLSAGASADAICELFIGKAS